MQKLQSKSTGKFYIYVITIDSLLTVITLSSLGVKVHSFHSEGCGFAFLTSIFFIFSFLTVIFIFLYIISVLICHTCVSFGTTVRIVP
jgi:hypothetical protein